MQRLAGLCFLLAFTPGAGDASSEAAAAQLRGSGRAEGDAAGECSAGLVGRLRERSEDSKACLDACPGSCAALGQALSAYLRQGGAEAAKEAVCRQPAAFRCYVTGSAASKCSSLLGEAAEFGFSLPRSASDLETDCGQGDAAPLEEEDLSAAQALRSEPSVESALQARASAAADQELLESTLGGKKADSRCDHAPEGQTCVANPHGGHSNAWIYCSNRKRLSAGETSCERRGGHLSWCQSNGVGLRRGYCDDPFCRNGGANHGSGRYCHKGNVVLCQGTAAPRIVESCSDQTSTEYFGGKTCQVTKHYRCAGGFPHPFCQFTGKTRNCQQQFASSLLAAQAPTSAAAADSAEEETASDESLHAVMTGMATANATEATQLGAAEGGCYADPGALRTCGTSCFSSRPRSSCISGCLLDRGLSSGCASCLGEKSDCSIKHCLSKCAASATGAACTECVKSHCHGCR